MNFNIIFHIAIVICVISTYMIFKLITTGPNSAKKIETFLNINVQFKKHRILRAKCDQQKIYFYYDSIHKIWKYNPISPIYDLVHEKITKNYASIDSYDFSIENNIWIIEEFCDKKTCSFNTFLNGKKFN